MIIIITIIMNNLITITIIVVFIPIIVIAITFIIIIVYTVIIVLLLVHYQYRRYDSCHWLPVLQLVAMLAIPYPLMIIQVISLHN